MKKNRHAFNAPARPHAPAATPAHQFGHDMIKGLRKQTPDMRDLMWLVKNGATLDVTDGQGETALHLALRAGTHDLVREILARGADVQRPNHAGNTPVIIAALGSADNLAAVLARKPDLRAVNKGGNDALTCAVAGGKIDNVQLLLAAGAPVHESILALAERLPRAALRPILQEAFHAQQEELRRRHSTTARDVTVLRMPPPRRPPAP